MHIEMFCRFAVRLNVQDGSSVNLSPLNTTVSKKAIPFSDTSRVNSIVGCDLLVCAIKRSTSFLL